MARYRKVDTRIWNDAKFRNLSDQEKLLFLFLLTHPHMTSLGAMRASIRGLAEELGNQPETVSKGFGILFRNGFLEYDEKACFVALPNFLKYNAPDNPNVVKSWDRVLDLIPECDLKLILISRVKRFLETSPEQFRNGMPNGFETSPKQYRIQEQEQEQDYIKQEQEQKQDQDSSSGSSSLSGSRPTVSKITAEKTATTTTTTFAVDDFILTDELRQWAETVAPDVNPDIEAEAFRDHYGRDGTRFVNPAAAFRKWFRNTIEREKRARSPGRRESIAEHNARIFREVEAEDRAKAAKAGGSS